MAQMNTRWYSGKISTSSPIERKQKSQAEEPQILKKFVQANGCGPTSSKVSLRRQVASASRIQAGKDTGVGKQHSNCKVGSHSSLDLTTQNVCQLESNKAACNIKEKQIKPITTKTTDQVKFNLTFKGLSTLDKQRFGDIKSSAAATSAEFGSWVPYYFVQTLRQKMQETPNKIVSNRTIEVHYFGNETMSKTIDVKTKSAAATTTTTVTGGHAKQQQHEQQQPNQQQQQQQTSSSSSNCKRCGRITIKRRISYKCPKKNPKFRAKFIETRKTEVVDKESLASSNFECTMLNLCPKPSQASRCNSESKTTLKRSYAQSIVPRLGEQLKSTNIICPTSKDQNLNRNTSPASKKFKTPSDAELEINLASVSPSPVSSMVETMSRSTSGVLSTLQALESTTLSHFEGPVSPRDHESYLAQVEHLKEHLERSIQKSQEQRKALDAASQSTIKSLSERSPNRAAAGTGVSKSHKRHKVDKMKPLTADHSKQRSKRSVEKSYHKNCFSKLDDVSCRIHNLPPKPEPHHKPKSSSTNVPFPKTGPFKDRKKLSSDRSKTKDTPPNISVATASNEPLSPDRTGDLEFSPEQSQDSNSSTLSDYYNTHTRDLLKNRIKRFVAEAKVANLSLQTETATPAGDGVESTKTSSSSPRMRNLENSVLSSHDRAQLVAIANLKERLRRSIREFKKHKLVLGDIEHQLGDESKFSINTVRVEDSGGGVERTKACTHLAYADESPLSGANERSTWRCDYQHLKGNHEGAACCKWNDVKASRANEHLTKPRKLAHALIQKQNLMEQNNFEPPKKEFKKCRKQFNDEEGGVFTATCSKEDNSVKYSKAKTSLHCCSLSDKENVSPTKTEDLMEQLAHTNSTDSINKNSTLQSTRSKTTQTNATKSEKIAQPKHTINTTTIGTQFSNTSNVDWFEHDATDSENESNEMDLQTLMNPQTTRSQALSAVLKARYKSLMERARGEFAWLQLKKQRYKAKGLHERIAVIRRKQQIILRKMESERNMIQRVLESTLVTPFMHIDPTTTTTTTKPQKRPKLSPSHSAPDIGAAMNERQPSITERLNRVEHLLAWNFSLDEKEADVTDLEHILMDCNQNIDISAETSTKNLLYRIRKMEDRLEELTDKLASLENNNTLKASSQLIVQDSNDQQRPTGTASKLNQFWQRLTSAKRTKYNNSMKQNPQDAKYKQQTYNSEEEEDIAAFEEFRKYDDESPSSSSQFIVYREQRFSSSTHDDGVIVLYSPKMPSLSLKLSSEHHVPIDEASPPLSKTVAITNPTYPIPKRYNKAPKKTKYLSGH